MIKKKLLVVALILVMLILSTGCSGNKPAEQGSDKVVIEHPKSLVICASTMGGTWHSAATKISELIMMEFPDMSVSVIEGASDSNLQLVNSGRDAQMGFSSSISVMPAFDGSNPVVTDASNLEVVLPITSSFIQTAVWADSNIKTYPDLVGKNVSPGTQGMASKLGFEAIMEAYGYSIADMEKAGTTYQLAAWGEYPDLMGDGHIEACSLNGPVPASIFMQLEASKPIRILNCGKEEQKVVLAKYPSLFVKTFAPGGYKGTTEAVDLFGYAGMLVANAELPDAFLVRVVELLQENKEAIQKELPLFDLLGWENATIGMNEKISNKAVWELIQANQ
ncbi:MAG: TAXI family TRAP transporter solute-binding subunit [Clostridia bacterium]|jgi:TRAP transporter TAXI family solute receptor|nr:TAXI family TRAP transporter solute-binding subunit [Clostridia bacterium]